MLHIRRLDPTDALTEMVDLQLGVEERVNLVVDWNCRETEDCYIGSC